MRRRGKVDSNHTEIVRALRDIGATVISLAPVGGGCPDLLVGYRCHNVLLEVKDGDKFPSRRALTPEQKRFFELWRGQCRVVESADEAVAVLSNAYRQCYPSDSHGKADPA